MQHLTHKRQYNKLKYVKIQMRRKMSTKKMSKYKRDMKCQTKPQNNVTNQNVHLYPNIMKSLWAKIFFITIQVKLCYIKVALSFSISVVKCQKIITLATSCM